MTFSITARCPKSGMLGVAVTSSSMAVAARCAFVRAGTGAVATQNITDPRLGPQALDLMAEGMSASQALEAIVSEHVDMQFRQLVLVDSAGRCADFSGARTLGCHGVATAEGAVAAGNLLSGVGVPHAMIEAFKQGAAEHLAERLVRTLEAGLAAGGEEGPVRSAGLLVADKQAWPYIDLRVDWSEDNPIAELRKIWLGWRPQMDDYVTRAVNPSAAPSYGVPGDR
ncbi:MAG: DUF1028 domain-containing protein [Kiloniellales bacterium]